MFLARPERASDATPRRLSGNTVQAQYSSTIWEAVLEEILGERRMIDTISSADNPKVVICSTIINVNPLEMMLWRNYGFRPDQETVYKVIYDTTGVCGGVVESEKAVGHQRLPRVVPDCPRR